MTVRFLKGGESAPGVGGQFEIEFMRMAREKLDATWTIIGNMSISSHRSHFYEYDVILTKPNNCLIIELKCIRPRATVYEDRIDGINSFCISNVFSILENKARVLKSRLYELPFGLRSPPFVDTQLVVPDETELVFKHKQHKENKKVVTANAALQQLRLHTSQDARLAEESQRQYESWRRFTQEWSRTSNRTARGRMHFNSIIKQLLGLVRITSYS